MTNQYTMAMQWSIDHASEYAARVTALENEGFTTSDAQAIVDAEIIKQLTKGNNRD